MLNYILYCTVYVDLFFITALVLAEYIALFTK